MPEVDFWSIVTALGVPGLAIGILYMLFRKLNWRVPMLPKNWVGPTFVLFLIVVWSVVLVALFLYSPSTDSTAELVTILEGRAQTVIEKIDNDIHAIEQEAFKASNKFGGLIGRPIDTSTGLPLKEPMEERTSPFMTGEPHNQETNSEIATRIMKESFDISEGLRAIKTKFISLHQRHIDALRAGHLILAREYSARIWKLLSAEYEELGLRNIGIDPGAYAHGYRKVLVDVRSLIGNNDYSVVYFPEGDPSK